MDLPETVTVLDGPFGGKVYLVGTAHFSEKSCRDVEEVIRKTKPNIVVLELCQNRMHILDYDEKRVLEEVESLGLAKLRATIKEYGLVQGLLTICFLSLSAQMTKQMGMFPGGEFRAAFREAKKIPGCILHLGDRPISITLSRGLSSLGWWRKMKLAYQILTNTEKITPEEVERCKEKGVLGQMLSEMATEYPSLSEVFVNERNLYLAYSLQLASSPVPSEESPLKLVPSTVVGVVGIGHVAGIVENWGIVSEEDIAPLMSIPQPSASERIVRKTIKYALISMCAYAGYKFLFPRFLKEFLYTIPSRTHEILQVNILPRIK
ncbi:traB domain-containing protein [Brevipalpus obovatus]|uniref:traB domain-containing protein n=1 Tax=Brevipalpus obovatus TaxID=246614 RepID=UPI003D9E5E31